MSTTFTLTFSNITRGPATPETVLYSEKISKNIKLCTQKISTNAVGIFREMTLLNYVEASDYDYSEEQ